MSGSVIIGDALAELRNLPDESVNCVVTSPPYWGLRDYGTASWEGGDPTCEHKGRPKPRQDTSGGTNGRFTDTRGTQPAKAIHAVPVRSVCACGARRVDQQIGLEETPGAYVEKIVTVFREVRRVLRSDGICWINLGDSYAGSWGAQSRDGSPAPQSEVSANQIAAHPHRAAGTGSLSRTPGLKAKDLVGIPWRVAFALQADGWWLRSDVIWAKPNPMPESVMDRPTKAHEYLFLLAKSERYHYDAAAIREPQTAPEASTPDDVARAFSRRRTTEVEQRQGDVDAAALGRKRSGNKQRQFRDENGGVPGHAGNQAFGVPWVDRDGLRNKRSVWTIATQSNPEAHFATFPEALVSPCILAGCPGGGVVLDPFGGTGTVARVAEDLGRRWLLIELNPEYAAMAERRMRQQGLFGGAA